MSIMDIISCILGSVVTYIYVPNRNWCIMSQMNLVAMGAQVQYSSILQFESNIPWQIFIPDSNNSYKLDELLFILVF